MQYPSMANRNTDLTIVLSILCAVNQINESSLFLQRDSHLDHHLICTLNMYFLEHLELDSKKKQKTNTVKNKKKRTLRLGIGHRISG